jgi:hypothetical protein
MTRKTQSMQRRKLFTEEEQRQDDMSIASPNIDFAHIGITDDRMFGTVFQNEEECRELLQRILGIHIREIHVIAQMPIEGSFFGKGSRLDIYAKDEDGNIYDIEMQTTMQKILPLRSRYFFVNIGGNRDGLSEDLTKLLDYFKTGTPMDAYTQGLQEEVEEARYDDEWRTNYMTFEMMMEEKKQEGRAEGREEGEAIGELKSIIALVIKKMQRGKFLEETAEELEEDVAVIAPIYEAVKEAAPEYDVEEIYRKVRSKEGQMIPKERQL